MIVNARNVVCEENAEIADQRLQDVKNDSSFGARVSLPVPDPNVQFQVVWPLRFQIQRYLFVDRSGSPPDAVKYRLRYALPS
jgi:hypothetical protein